MDGDDDEDEDDDDGFSENPRACDTVLVSSDEVCIGGRRVNVLPNIYLKSNQRLLSCSFVLLLGSVGTKGREDVRRSHTRRGESGSSSWSY
jgi:hypothetical protein